MEKGNLGENPPGGIKSFLETWWIAARPFSFPASVIPVLFGSVLGVTVGNATFKPFLFALSLLGVVLLHAGANILNDIEDFKKGVDKTAQPGSGAVVRGLVEERTAFLGSLICSLAGIAFGIVVAAFVGWPIVVLGTAGFAIGTLYTAGPFAFKYHGLGDLAVFMDFGILGTLGAWIVQTGSFSWVPVLWAVPVATLVAAILHANNWRDIQTDTEKGVRTIASLLGKRRSFIYYAFLILGPFITVGMLVLITQSGALGPAMPLTFLFTWLLLPVAFKLVQRAFGALGSGKEEALAGLDAATAQLNLLFGLVCTAAPLLYALTGKAW